MALNKELKAIGILVAVMLLVAVPILAFQYGSYQRQASLGLHVESGYCMHINVYLQRNGKTETVTIKDGVALNNAGTLTTIGKNWVEDQLGDSPSTDPAKWISLSSNGGTPSAAWTQIPSEIASDGLERAAGTYASTGDGQWTISKQFTASGTLTDVGLTGLQWVDAGDNNLLGADRFTNVTLNSGDKLTVTWTVTVS